MPTIDQITAYIESLSQDDRPSVVLPKEPARIAILEVLQNKAILLTRQSNWTTLLSNLLEHHDEDPRFQEARRMVLRILIGPDLSKRLVYFIKYLVLGPEKFAIYKDQEVDTIKGALGAVTDFLAYIATGNADYWRSFVMRLWRGRTDVPMSDVDRHNLSLYFASHLEILVPDNVYGCAKGILLPIWQLFLEPKTKGLTKLWISSTAVSAKPIWFHSCDYSICICYGEKQMENQILIWLCLWKQLGK